MVFSIILTALFGYATYNLFMRGRRAKNRLLKISMFVLCAPLALFTLAGFITIFQDNSSLQASKLPVVSTQTQVQEPAVHQQETPKATLQDHSEFFSLLLSQGESYHPGGKLTKPYEGAYEYYITDMPEIAREVILVGRDNDPNYKTIILSSPKVVPIQIAGQDAEFESITMQNIIIKSGKLKNYFYEEYPEISQVEATTYIRSPMGAYQNSGEEVRNYVAANASELLSDLTPQQRCLWKAERAFLVINNWSWYEDESGFVVSEGSVTNKSDQLLENIVAITEFYTANEASFITSSKALLEYTALLPGQSSPFKIYADSNPAMETAHLNFVSFDGQLIPTTLNAECG